MKYAACLSLLCLIVAASGIPPVANAEEAAEADSAPAKVEQFKYQVTGLFCPEREQDLQTLFAESFPEIKLIHIDYDNAEATFAYDPAAQFPNAKPEQYLERFDQMVRQASRGTFTVKPPRTIPLEKLDWVEIPIVGLDCKACSLAVYEYVMKLAGVEQAFASFKEGKVTALIDPTQVTKAAIEKTLTDRRVTLATPAE